MQFRVIIPVRINLENDTTDSRAIERLVIALEKITARPRRQSAHVVKEFQDCKPAAIEIDFIYRSWLIAV